MCFWIVPLSLLFRSLKLYRPTEHPSFRKVWNIRMREFTPSPPTGLTRNGATPIFTLGANTFSSAFSSLFAFQAFYQNDSTLVAPPHPLVIPGCLEDCPLNTWSNLLQAVIPLDWNDECYRSDAIRDHKYIMALTGLSSVFGSALLFLIWWLAFRKRFSSSPSSWFKDVERAKEPLTKIAFPDYGALDRDGYVNWSKQPRSLWMRD